MKNSVLLMANYSNTTGYAWNNIYRLFNILAKGLDEQGIGVCLSFKEVSGSIDFINNEVSFETILFDPYSVNMRNLLDLMANVRSKNIKYVYMTDQRTFRFLYLMLRLSGVEKIIVHSRTSVPNPHPAVPEKGFKKLIKTIIHRIPWICPDYIYTVSEFVRHRIINKNCYPAAKTVKILNGINIDKFKCDDNKQQNDAITIFTGSRATKYKGIGILIKAASILKHDFNIDRFRIEYAGDGPDIVEFKEMVKKLNLQSNFIFLGQLKHTRDNVCKSDIVVVPSVWGDAYPSSVSEALAAGKPLITTKAGGIPEIVGEEQNAVLVAPADEMELANALADLITNSKKRAELSVNARERAEQALNEDDYYKTFESRFFADILHN
ncbi:MAG: glycosyltransferase family 4 protein [Candidatus Thiodiazotropha sp.]